MIKVENENVKVMGSALDVLGELQALCDYLNKELGEDFAVAIGIIAERYLKRN